MDKSTMIPKTRILYDMYYQELLNPISYNKFKRTQYPNLLPLEFLEISRKLTYEDPLMSHLEDIFYYTAASCMNGNYRDFKFSKGQFELEITEGYYQIFRQDHYTDNRYHHKFIYKIISNNTHIIAGTYDFSYKHYDRGFERDTISDLKVEYDAVQVGNKCARQTSIV